MSDEVKNEENKENRVENRVPPQLTPFVKGKEKTGGKKKGYRSARFVIRDMLQELNGEKDPTKRTVLQMLFDKQVEIAVEKGDKDTLKFIMEQAGDLITPNIQRPPEGNFFNVESMKQIINNNGFLGIEEGDDDMIEEEVIEVRDLKLE